MKAGACLSRAVSRAPVRRPSVGGARGGNQRLSRRGQRARVSAQSRARPGLPDRRDQRTRRGAADLSGRRPRAASLGRTAPGGRHRRRVDRIHHRPRTRARSTRVADPGLRQHDAEILSRRDGHRERVRRRGDRGAGRNRSHRRRFRRRSLERRVCLVGDGGGARRDPRAERVFRRRDHAGRARPPEASAWFAPAIRHGSSSTRSSPSACRCSQAAWPS